MKIYKKKYVSLGIIFLICLFSISAFITIENNPIETEIQENPLPKLSAGEIDITTPENKTYTKAMSGYYPATYGFENDAEYSNPSGWTINENLEHIVDVIDEKNEHKKVVKFYDDSSANYALLYKVFDFQASGTLEWYAMASQTNKNFYMGWLDAAGTTYAFRINFYSNGYITYYDGSHHNMMTYSANNWYHFKIEFECGSGGYKGLSADTYNLYINGDKILTGKSFWNMGYGIIRHTFFTDIPESGGQEFYIDALGVSWDEYYNIGDNLNEGLLLSFFNNTNLDWIGYSLDGQENRTIYGNTTISLPSFGQHIVQIFGNDSIGNTYASELRHFRIRTDSGEFYENFSTLDYMDSIVSNVSGWSSGSIKSPDRQSPYVAHIDTIWNSRKFSVLGNYLYVASYHGLEVYDISDPRNPTFTTSRSISDYGYGIHISGNYLYLAGLLDGLLIYDITTPTNPTLITSVNSYFYNGDDRNLWAVDVFVSGQYAYIASASSYAFAVFNINNPSNPYHVSSLYWSEGSLNTRIHVAGNYAYMSDFDDVSLRVIYISNPFSPSLADTYDTSSEVNEIFVSGNYAYLGADDLIILDVSTPTNIIYQSTYVCPRVYSVYVSGGLAYLGLSNSLQIVIVSDPTHPTLSESHSAPFLLSDVYYQGNFIYTLLPLGLDIYDMNYGFQYEEVSVAQSISVYHSESTLITQARIILDVDWPTPTNIDFYLSADNGSNWESVFPCNILHFSNIGNSLKWKAILTNLDPYETAEIFSINISYWFKPLIEAPILINPTYNSNLNDNTPNFQWQLLNEVSGYLIEIDTLSSFDSPFLISENIINTNYIPLVPLSDGTWYWKVQATDGDGDLGHESDIYNFTIDTTPPSTPILISPSNYSIFNDEIYFSWNNNLDASNYTLQLDTSITFSTINLKIINGIVTSSYTYLSPLTNDTWYWRVCAYDQLNNQGSFSSSNTFYYDIEGPIAPSLVSPLNDIYITYRAPSFSWNTVSDAVNYTLQIDTSTNFDSAMIKSFMGLLTPSYSLTTDLEEAYSNWHWRVCAYDLVGNQGQFSSIYTLHIDTIAPIFLNQTPGITYREGTEGNNLIWYGSDLNPASYVIERDFLQIKSETWDGSPIQLDIDGLSEGEHLFECFIYDKAGNSESQMVIVNVERRGESDQNMGLIITLSVIGVAAVPIIYLIIRKFRNRPE